MLGLMKYDPFRGLTSRRGLDSWLFGPSISNLYDNQRRLYPNVDIAEDEGQYRIIAEMPGFSSDEVNIEYKDGVLKLTAEREENEDRQEKNYHLRERYHGSFVRSFRLPDDADGDKIEASMKNGVLTVHVSKLEKVEPKKIEIQVH